jgi:hypothetical protein
MDVSKLKVLLHVSIKLKGLEEGTVVFSFPRNAIQEQALGAATALQNGNIEEQVALARRMLAEVGVTWDLTDNGVPVPVTEETLREHLDALEAVEVFGKIMEAVGPVGKQKETPSASG